MTVKRFKFYSLDLNGNGIIDVDGGLQLPVEGDYPLEVGESVRIYTKNLIYLGTDGADGAIFQDPLDKSFVYGSDTRQLNAGEPLPEIVEEPLELNGGGETPEPPADVPVVSISPPEVNQDEGNEGTTEYTFTVTRTGTVLGGASTVDVAFVAGDTDAADFGGTLPETVTVTFAPGETEKTVTVSVSGDTDFELDETFELQLEFAIGAVIDSTASSAAGTILNDDEAPIDPEDFNQIDGGAGPDTLVGTDGNDIIRGFENIDILLGNAGNDILNGGTDNDFLDGGDGDDILLGGTNGDVLEGGAGNDIIFGQGGEDVLRGEEGNDILNGGERSDLFEFSGDFGDDIITDFDQILDGIRLVGAEAADISAEEVSNGTLITVTDEDTFGSVLLLGVTELDPEFFV